LPGRLIGFKFKAQLAILFPLMKGSAPVSAPQLRWLRNFLRMLCSSMNETAVGRRNAVVFRSWAHCASSPMPPNTAWRT
jgi:hypothetical protein